MTEMPEDSRREFEKFKDYVLLSPDDVTAVLRAHLLAEYYVDQLLIGTMLRGSVIIERFDYLAQKVDVLEGMDVLRPPLLSSIRKLNKVRAQCTHEIDFKISESDVDSIGAPFGLAYLQDKLDGKGDMSTVLRFALTRTISQLAGKTLRITSKRSGAAEVPGDVEAANVGNGEQEKKQVKKKGPRRASGSGTSRFPGSESHL